MWKIIPIFTLLQPCGVERNLTSQHLDSSASGHVTQLSLMENVSTLPHQRKKRYERMMILRFQYILLIVSVLVEPRVKNAPHCLETRPRAVALLTL